MNDGPVRSAVGGLDLQTDLWWLAMFFTGLMGTLFGAVAFSGAGEFWLWLVVLVRLAMALSLAQQPWGRVFAKLLELGLVAGIFSIFADYLLQTWRIGPREYLTGAQVLLRSPLHVPLLWTLAVIEFGYPSVRIYGLVSRKKPGEMALGITMVASGLLAMVVTIATDSMAVIAGWWVYKGAYISVGNAGAVHVIVAQFFVFFGFPAIFIRFAACTSGRLYAALRFGIILAGAVFAGYAVGHLLIEKSLQ